MTRAADLVDKIRANQTAIADLINTNLVWMEALEEEADVGLELLVPVYRGGQVTKTAIDKANRGLMVGIRERAEATGEDKVEGDGWTVGRRAGRSTLKPTLLLDLGVTQAQIEAATVEGDSYWVVTGRKMEGDG